MANKRTEPLISHPSSSQPTFSVKRRHLIIAFALTTIVVMMYHGERLITNLDPGKDNSFIGSSGASSDRQINTTVSFTRTDLNLVTNKSIFVELKDIPKSMKNIYFTETRCSTEALRNRFSDSTKLVLSPRQVCAVESTALTNPEHSIYILYTCPLADRFINFQDYSKSIFTLPNIFIVRLNLTEFFKSSPVEELYISDKLESSIHPMEHFSDLLRFTALWKFGGTYLDLDVVTIKSLLDLGTNFAGIEDASVINSAVFNVEPQGAGHDLVQKALQYVNEHFDGNGWISNGPEVLTRLILKECNQERVDEKLYNCDRFHLLPSKYFYYIHWSREEDLFNAELGPRIVEELKNNSYVVHMWNKLTYKHVVHVNSTQAYGLLANQFCPNVFNNCGKEF